ncbi:MAG: sugar phosphate isomerase/epimerase family protein [Bacteroidota bacterium]
MKKLKFACADYTFPLLPHDSVLSVIALLDCKGVDIGLFSRRSHLTPETEFQQPANRAKLLRQKLEDRGLVATDVYLQLDTDFYPHAINHPEKSRRQLARDGFLKLVEYASELGADHITCLPGMIFPGEERNASIQRCYEELSWRLETVASSGLVFAIEVHIGCPFINPSDTQILLESVPGLTLTLDYTHYIYDGYAQKNVDPFLQNTSHFHARGGKERQLQTIMSENIIDYSAIARKLKSANYNGWIGLEYIWTEWEKCNQADNISETILLKNIMQEAYEN